MADRKLVIDIRSERRECCWMERCYGLSEWTVQSATATSYNLRLCLSPRPDPLVQNFRAIAIESALSTHLPPPLIGIINGYSTVACPLGPELGPATLFFILCHGRWSLVADWIPPIHMLFEKDVNVGVKLSAAFFGDDDEAEAMRREVSDLNFPKKASIVKFTLPTTVVPDPLEWLREHGWK